MKKWWIILVISIIILIGILYYFLFKPVPLEVRLKCNSDFNCDWSKHDCYNVCVNKNYPYPDKVCNTLALEGNDISKMSCKCINESCEKISNNE